MNRLLVQAFLDQASKARSTQKKWKLVCECLESREMLSTSPLKVLVPAYIYPSPRGSAWKQLDTSAKTASIVAIMNPDSGPGSQADSNYVTAVDNLQAAGGQVIGYVDSGYASIPLSTVESEISDYLNWYHVNGIFVDDMTDDSGSTDVSYYQSIYQYAHGLQSNWTVVGNPGTTVPENYVSLPVADVLVTYEDNTGYGSATPPSWQYGYPAGHFANVVDHVPSIAAMESDVKLAASRDVGWVYVTNENDPNPYASLPSFWTQFVAAANGTPTLPLSPANVQTKAVSTGQIDLSWNAVSGVTGYHIYEVVRGIDKFLGSTTAAHTTFGVTGLAAGGTYDFQVASYNSSGQNLSAEVTGTTLPATPTNIALRELSTAEYAISWSAAAGAAYYDIYFWNGTTWAQYEETSKTYVDYNVVPGDDYLFDVEAINSVGVNGTPSAEKSFKAS
jgi:hypothetical protein